VAGPSAKRGFLFFFWKNLCQAPLAKAVGKEGGFIFFGKNLCREPLAMAVGKGVFFLKKTFAERN
jgi:hypothetical protein